MSYHYGQTIREYRIASGITLEQLASQWPSKEVGVNIRYVIDVEAGRKRITDVQTLRKLAVLLHIPLWKFGLSEYDPFRASDLEVTFTNIATDYELIDGFIKQIWVTKVTSGINIDSHIQLLESYFQKVFAMYPDDALIRQDIYGLYAQVKRLQAVRSYDHKDYHQALRLFREMLNVAQKDKNPVSLALSHMGMGIELLRTKQRGEALEYLEQARDYTFHTSKQLAALVHSLLSRAYAEKGDATRFERAYHTALSLGTSLGNNRLNTQDYAFHSLSGIMLEVSSGYILLKKPQQSLEILPSVERQIEAEQNIYLNMWVPLDYSQAYMEAHKLEESIRYLRQFVERTRTMRTQHIDARIREQLADIAATFGAHSLIDDFKEEYLS